MRANSSRRSAGDGSQEAALGPFDDAISPKAKVVREFRAVF